MRRTKIVATIGPACSTPESLLLLVEAGMDAARLNFSHGEHAEHVARAKLVRGVPLPIPSLTEKDLADLKLALELEVDFVALSFVRAADDVHELRKIIDEAGSSAGIIAKIEMPEAIDALDEILDATDAVMVARGDLGVEAGPAAVPLLQKRIIKESLELGKPVITATQMPEARIPAPQPSRARAAHVRD